MRYLLFFALSMILGGCFFDSSSSGSPSDAGPETAQGDGGSSTGHGSRLPHLRGQDAGPDARVQLADGGDDADDGGRDMMPDDAAVTLRDAATPPSDSGAPAEDSGTQTDGSAPAGSGLTCTPCSAPSDCAPGYECRAPGRCMIQVQDCTDVDPDLTNLLDGDGSSRWCLPAYEIGVQRMGISEGCDTWLAKH